MSKENKTETGNICHKPGRYYCKSHPAIEITVHKDDYFPSCSKGAGHSTTWINF